MNFKTNDKKLKKILNTRLKLYDGKMYIKFYNKKETQQNHPSKTKWNTVNPLFMIIVF